LELFCSDECKIKLFKETVNAVTMYWDICLKCPALETMISFQSSLKTLTGCVLDLKPSGIFGWSKRLSVKSKKFIEEA